MHSMSAAREEFAGGTASRWSNAAGWACAIVLSAIFLVSGLWKTLDPFSAAERMIQSLIPAWLSMPVAIAAGTAETFVGVLLLVPRWRRWGAWLGGLMLIAFMIYIGVLYDRLLGDDCNCFPWIRRVVGPLFFITDALMVAVAVGAAVWSRRPSGMRAAALLLVGVMAFAFTAFGIRSASRTGLEAPASIVVDGQPQSLGSGHFVLFFFEPECSHCAMVAREMSKQQWRYTEVIAVPTSQPQWAGQFLKNAGLNARVSSDAAKLREIWKFTDAPYVVALSQGRQVAVFNSGELECTYYNTLRNLGFIK